jgi:hypothetical protein
VQEYGSSYRPVERHVFEDAKRRHQRTPTFADDGRHTFDRIAVRSKGRRDGSFRFRQGNASMGRFQRLKSNAPGHRGTKEKGPGHDSRRSVQHTPQSLAPSPTMPVTYLRKKKISTPHQPQRKPHQPTPNSCISQPAESFVPEKSARK